MKYNNKNKKSGFTLIELLVVIAIIGMLSSVLLSSINSARAKGRDARRKSEITHLRSLLQLYADKNEGNFPKPVNMPNAAINSRGGNSKSCDAGGNIQDWNDLLKDVGVNKMPIDIVNDESRCYFYFISPDLKQGTFGYYPESPNDVGTVVIAPMGKPTDSSQYTDFPVGYATNGLQSNLIKEAIGVGVNPNVGVGGGGSN